MLRVYLIEDNLQFAERFINEAVDGGLLGVAGHCASPYGSYQDLLDAHPDVVVISQSDLSAAVAISAEITRDFGLSTVLAARPEQCVIETYRLARGSGAKNVLRKPYTVRELLYAIESAEEYAQGAHHEGGTNRQLPWTRDKREHAPRDNAGAALRREVIAVYSPKGGVGKSTISASVALALKAVKAPSLSVCIVDMDTNFLSLPTLFCVKPASGIDAWQGYSADDMDQTLVESLLTRHESGIYLLSAPELPSVIPGAEAQKIIQVLMRYFDVVIIDCTISVHQDSIMTALDLATKVLLVTTPDVLAIKKVADFVPAIPKLRINPAKMRLVVNMLRSDSIPVKEIHAAIPSLPLAGTVPHEPKMAKMIFDKQPPYSLQDTLYNDAIRRLANTAVPVFARSAGGGGQRRGLLSRAAK